MSDSADPFVEQLATTTSWSYQGGGPTATEPAALAALVLLAHGRSAAARRPLDWLVRAQSRSGAVGVTAAHDSPCWPTSLALLAWTAARELAAIDRYQAPAARAVAWTLDAKGDTFPQTSQLGHDTTLTGWPWVLGTHSWLEPTALHVTALKAAGQSGHARTREAVRLLVDRQLPDGGFNYGNTLVLGQMTRPHLLPSGLALLALAGEGADVEASLRYLENGLDARTGTPSLAFGLLGLAAHGRQPAGRGAWLAAAAARARKRGLSAHRAALLALAELGESAPLVALARQGAPV